MEEKALYILDGHALAYRAYYAMIRNPLTNSSGQPTGAVYGFALYLLRLLEHYSCPYITIVFDSDVPTFRHEMYKEYKANREAMPDDMVSQIPLIERLVKEFNIPVVKKDGYEADDLIAHLCRIALDEDFSVFLVTKDKDLMQLVNHKITMLAPESAGKISEYGPKQVEEKMGVKPAQIRDLLALMGDSSDNIPGVPGVGPKTAIKILQKAKSVDALLENPSLVENEKLQKKIEQYREQLLLSKELATLDDRIEIDIPLDSLKKRNFNVDACIELFKELEFTSLLNNPLFSAHKELSFKTVIPGSIDEVRGIVDTITAAGSVSIDTETTSTTPHEAALVGISLAVDPSTAYYLPLGHTETDKNLDTEKVISMLKEIVESETIEKTGQNLKYDYQVLKNYGCTLRGITFDTMIAAYCIDPGKRHYALDLLATELLQIQTTSIESLIGKRGKEQRSFAEVSVDDAAHYSGEDVVVPLLLREKLEPELEQRGLKKLFTEIEVPLISVLAEMEYHGILLDTGLLATLSGSHTEALEKISEEIFEYAGERFNLNSPKQISDIFFTKLQMPKSKKTKIGLSTNVDALEKLAPDYPIARKLLDYRELQKLLSTYIDALPAQISKKSNRLHSSFNQTVAATGRLSSTGPNLQNIPVRTESGRRIREAFVAPKNFRLVSADYSQIELRILAHCSKDSFLIDAFKNDRDIHAQTASAIYGVFPEMVTAEMRRNAKVINFGLMYGMGPINLSRQLQISFKEAQQFIDNYFSQFPEIQAYIKRSIEVARQKGYTETLLGRRRYLPEIDSDRRQVREAAERTAINTPVQGTAADIIKIAMIQIHAALHESFPTASMLLQIHDELLFEVPAESAQELGEWVSNSMTNAYRLDVPLKVDIGIGANWSDAH
jgi:DNA polymerase-1